MLHRPHPADLQRMRLVHDPAYLHALEEPGALTPILGMEVDPGFQDRYLEFQRFLVGGTLRATRHALRRRYPAMNLGGGLHHAYRDRGSGFCVFNDVAVAVASMRAKGFDRPVLVVDLDLHDGDGTRSIFAEDPTVHTLSIHNHDLEAGPAVASTSVALGSDVDDDTYLAAVREHVPRAFADVKPGLVFYVAGADPNLDDRLGDWRISLPGLLERDRFVLDQAGHGPRRRGDVPCVIVMGGGYGPRAWRHGAALGSWLLTSDSFLDIPVDLELPVGHYRRLARLMKDPGHGGRSGLPAPEDWGLSHEELGALVGAPEELFLGRYTRHGMELAMEESGLMDRLRRRGYRDLRLDLDLDDVMGHTLRVRDGAGGEALLEVRLRLDRASLPGRTLLMVEWLLIQDAGQRYEMTRPLLPGQQHPGMGLLRDTAAVLIVVCERLELDGLAYTPSHYHLARLSRPQARFADADAEGRFRAVARAVRPLHMAEATAAVEGGRVVEAATGEVLAWRPSLMVIPVSAPLHTHFIEGEWPTRAQAVAESLPTRLVPAAAR
jgi:acetoin utilization deacetylase AcuC-like enzyme